MDPLGKLVDLKQTPEERMAAIMPSREEDCYPSGLCLCLSDDVLTKIDMNDDLQVDDLIHFTAMARVTSVSKTGGVGLQIVMMSGVEDENTEGMDEDDE